MRWEVSARRARPCNRPSHNPVAPDHGARPGRSAARGDVEADALTGDKADRRLRAEHAARHRPQGPLPLRAKRARTVTACRAWVEYRTG